MRQNLVISIFAITGLFIGALSLVPAVSSVRSTANQVASAAQGDVEPAAPAKNPAVERLKRGENNCRGCNLRGADLTRLCVKNGDLTGADFSDVTARYMCMSYANFTDVSFKNANLTGVNLAHAKLTNADFTGAKLNIASIKGADLSLAKGLTQAQLDRACADAETKVPEGLRAIKCS